MLLLLFVVDCFVLPVVDYWMLTDARCLLRVVAVVCCSLCAGSLSLLCVADV